MGSTNIRKIGGSCHAVDVNTVMQTALAEVPGFGPMDFEVVIPPNVTPRDFGATILKVSGMWIQPVAFRPHEVFLVHPAHFHGRYHARSCLLARPQISLPLKCLARQSKACLQDLTVRSQAHAPALWILFRGWEGGPPKLRATSRALRKVSSFFNCMDSSMNSCILDSSKGFSIARK